MCWSRRTALRIARMLAQLPIRWQYRTFLRSQEVRPRAASNIHTVRPILSCTIYIHTQLHQFWRTCAKMRGSTVAASTVCSHSKAAFRMTARSSLSEGSRPRSDASDCRTSHTAAGMITSVEVSSVRPWPPTRNTGDGGTEEPTHTLAVRVKTSVVRGSVAASHWRLQCMKARVPLYCTLCSTCTAQLSTLSFCTVYRRTQRQLEQFTKLPKPLWQRLLVRQLPVPRN